MHLGLPKVFVAQGYYRFAQFCAKSYAQNCAHASCAVAKI